MLFWVEIGPPNTATTGATFSLFFSLTECNIKNGDRPTDRIAFLLNKNFLYAYMTRLGFRFDHTRQIEQKYLN